MPAVATAERRLIINADDYGLAPGVNAGILEAVRAGTVTSVSVMVNAPAFAEGMRHLAALAMPPSIGLHLNLTAGSPVCPAGEVPTLVDRSGRFRPLASLAARALTGRVRGRDVERETRAQLDRLRSMSSWITHLDGHRHVHALPGLWPAVCRAAEVRWIRRPVEPPVHRNRQGAWKRLLLGACWFAAATSGPRRAATLVRGIGMDGRHGFLDELLMVLDDLPPGLTELIVHPGHADPAIAALDPYDAPREAELAALLSGPLRARLDRGDLILTGFDA